MATITIKLNNKIFPVECEEAQIKLVQDSVQKLTDRFNQLKALSPTASTEYLLLLSAISIQSENINNSSNKDEKNEIEEVENHLKEIFELTKSITEKLKKF